MAFLQCFLHAKHRTSFKQLMFIKEEWEGVLLHERKLITWISSAKVIKCSVSMEKKLEIITTALTQKAPCISKSLLILACELTEEGTVIYYSLYNEQHNRALPCPPVGVTIRQILEQY